MNERDKYEREDERDEDRWDLWEYETHENVGATMPVNITPYTHQVEGYVRVMEIFGMEGDESISDGAALLMEMGTGKTLIAIGVAGTLSEYGRIKRMLVVCPLTVVGVWEAEFKKCANYPYTLTVLKGNNKNKQKQLTSINGTGLQVVVVNYESAWRIEKDLEEWGPDLIVTDEGHKIKNGRTKVSKGMHALGKIASYRLLLTGTPITNHEIDIYSQYKFLDPTIFGEFFLDFRDEFFEMEGYGGYTPVLREDMEQEFARRIHSIAYRKTKKECLDLPECTDVIRTVEFEPKANKQYHFLAHASKVWLAEGEKITAELILTLLLRLSQMTGGFVRADDGEVVNSSNSKLNALEDIVETAQNDGEKMVIIARFLPEISAIRNMLEKKKIQYVCISGDTKPEDRAEIIDSFQGNPKVRVFLGQIATAGMGITLTAASSMVFYSMDYSSANYDQCRARIHRSGQHHPCTYIHLIVKGTIDEAVLMAVQHKIDLAKKFTDDMREGNNPFIPSCE